ncbi:hypothetical protein BGZ61DRAFT_442524 [Ilyonectria robusta]|uniref:uncharacterized protein n=1 Tax=Ilyonectria robusta TaxID=1079257 RepID=UPI001E8E30BC|nr:uncharacterized protein BGZ61DRAFT_442524 [Ilyonectria robusta]KAH8734419.1 hypothetical protein BGZ61DRAFT_442524 [Ilyonectria robusta]
MTFWTGGNSLRMKRGQIVSSHAVDVRCLPRHAPQKHASSASEPIRTCMHGIRCPDDPKATPQRDAMVETSTFSAKIGSSVGRSKYRALLPLARNRELQVELPGVAVSPFFADGVGGIGFVHRATAARWFLSRACKENERRKPSGLLPFGKNCVQHTTGKQVYI